MLKICLQKSPGPGRPRLWWCATGELSFLPIHAASVNREDILLESATDYFVSSYVPTLFALIKARAKWRGIPRQKVTGILAACETSPDQSTLANVGREIELTKTCFTQAAVQVVHSSTPNTTLQQLRTALVSTNAHILHLACHAAQADRPLESALLMSDGGLSIQELMTIHLPDAVLTFLSACQTARGSERQPDQAVHLAASMLFCGFRSVIGTMW
jgi:CHAT domain-containing protein